MPHGSVTSMSDPSATRPISRPVVRPAVRDDLEAVLAIEAEAFEPSRRSSRASLCRALTSSFQRVWVLELDHALAGYVIVWPFRHTWRIYNLASDARFRNRGVGGALVSAVAAEAKRAGARRLVLESRLDPALTAFYQRRGFRVARRIPDYYAPGEDAARMVMPLSDDRSPSPARLPGDAPGG